MSEPKKGGAEPIAIIGSACRFPGASTSPAQLWELLKTPKDVLRTFPPERLHFSNFYNHNGDQHGCTNVENGSYLLAEDCRLFDAVFFRTSHKEAHAMDPQQRILLETVYEAFESAGWPLEKADGSQTSVHIGAMTADYHDIQMRDVETLPTYTATGTARSILANRISYFFNLLGPSMTIDTACSSSLVALHQAVQCLRNGDVDQAIVGGTTLLLDPSMYIAESKLHMLSPDSRSRMWDEDANGYARGEGCAVVILKPLSHAIRDNDGIECIIRETGVNCDGRTNGITMPNPSAQAALIQQTYKKAGLDPTKKDDRCQYFECHGTGTQVGDLAEAQAIKEAFFPDDEQPDSPISNLLYCGSIKTIIGHLEGAAGLAGILKVSLAIKNQTIPANMHFKRLSPKLEPFCHHLRIPTSPCSWPETNGRPLRASVNNFGFGGTNSHVIMESYVPNQRTPPPTEIQDIELQDNMVYPFVFSAKTRSSLIGYLKKMANYVEKKSLLELKNLSWTLFSRRTTFPFRVTIHASNVQQLHALLEGEIRMALDSGTTGDLFAVTPPALGLTEDRKLLGIFTGQGAQWAQMGRDLIRKCPLFRASLERCESALSRLPSPPSWSLCEELSAEDEASRIYQAEFSQPLCAGIQIALVDMLRATGVRFDVVVGHSSGEIAAAYAAGILNTRDAIGIAYYRGLVTQLAKNPGHRPGGMMAIGLSYHEATLFCDQPRFSGRICVAASNSPSSVTLSGDLTSINEAKEILDEDKIFTRVLQIDVGYHSHHMLHYRDLYTQCLQNMNINIQVPQEKCIWYSTVEGYSNHVLGSLEHFKSSYWVENMTRRVMFSQALDSVWSHHLDTVAVALEVGPHPALRGPVTQSMKAVTKAPIPYLGCLERGTNALNTMCAVMGILWRSLGPSFVKFDGWLEAFKIQDFKKVLKDLPTYVWDHDQIYWHESRVSRNYRLTPQSPHELLGRLREDCGDQITWRNFLHLNEIPWLKGHKFHGQVIFPAAAYITMAVQSAEILSRDHSVKVIEIRDMRIHAAVIIDDDEVEGAEIIFVVRGKTIAGSSMIEAEFCCYNSSANSNPHKSCEGRVLIHLEDDSSTHFPQNPISLDELPPLDVGRFFSVMADLGIDYDGVFRAICSINRIRGHAKASASWARNELGNQYIIHPAVLDIGFQAGFATFATLAEKSMGSTYLPSEIKRVIIDPRQKYEGSFGEIATRTEAYLVSANKGFVEVDINICAESSGVSGIQVEGLLFKAIGEPLPSDDRLIFAKTIWDADIDHGLPNPLVAQATKDDIQYIDAVERTALYFMKNLVNQTPADGIKNFKWHHQALFDAVQLFLQSVHESKNTVVQKEWLDDTWETISEYAQRYPDSVDIALLTAVGQNLPSVIRGESEMLEHMLKDNLLSRLYTEGRGFTLCNEHVANFMKNISYKYPRIRILEVGAGTGGTTESVLNAIGDAYRSYLFTDISAGFFEKAGERFSDRKRNLDFQTFNAELPPSTQGFTEGSFDVIIAANVLHATRNLSSTVRNIRWLLRPGGFLITVEVTGTMLREPGLMGGLEGWWLGRDEGRFPSPGISPTEWDDLLRLNGFSGIDSIAYDMADISRHNCSVFLSRATDQLFDLLCDPLSFLDSVRLPRCSVLVIGGQSLEVSKVARRVQDSAARWSKNVRSCRSLQDLDISAITPGTSVVCLTELDKPVFSNDLTPQTLSSLQGLFGSSQNVLWVTSGRLRADPDSNMMIGVGRALATELPQLRMQFLDFDNPSSCDVDGIMQQLLRMVILTSPEYLDADMLWAQEQEILVADGMWLVPRIIPDYAANEALNAKRRCVHRLAGVLENIEVSYADDKAHLTTQNDGILLEDSVEVSVDYSVAMHSQDETPCFLCYGHSKESDAYSLLLTSTDCSVAAASKEHIFDLPLHKDFNPDLLVALGFSLIASHIIHKSPTTGTILVVDPMEDLAPFISQAANHANRNILFVSTGHRKHSPGWLTINPLGQSRVMRFSIPHDTNIIWCLSRANLQNLLSCVSQHCEIHKFDASTLSHDRSAISAAYEMAITKECGVSACIVNIEKLPNCPKANSRLCKVIEWQRSKNPVSVIVSPLNPHQVFSSDKTYLLVGMTGELGQSLCQFMISSGARHIVLASRNPFGIENWLNTVRSSGADVRTIVMDVTNKFQVHKAISNIRETMPDIAGVANAALVLDDSLFVNTTIAAIEKQLQPKVDGTRHLDEEFGKQNLEFFILFSSLGTVYGNAGQSIYHAANMFLMAFAERRRLQGQPASVIDIGMITDVGYVAKSSRSGTNIEEHLRANFYTPLSETEFHELFLQSILCGQPKSPNAILTIGIEPFMDDPNASIRPQWYRNPRFSHMIVPTSSNEGPCQSPTSIHQQIQKGFDEAGSLAESTEYFQKLFALKIESMMKTPASSIDPKAPLSDLGLDSLLGVEIRSWLLKDMGVDIPLLMILGPEPMISISCRVAQSRFQGELTPAGSSQDSSSMDFTPPSVIINPLEPRLESVIVSSLPTDLVSMLGNPVELDLTSEYTYTERMSFPQASLHFLDSFLDDSTTFNITAQYSIRGELNISRFALALENTMSRHEAYRTSFYTESSDLEPRQGVCSHLKGNRFIHLHSDAADEPQKIFDALTRHKWQLTNGHTFQAVLITHSPNFHTVIFGCHHIVMDGLSWHIFLRDLNRAYEIYPPSPSKNTYLDFARQQMEQIGSEAFEESVKYWLRKLDPIPTVLPLLPISRTKMRQPQRVYGNTTIQVELDGNAANQIKDASQLCRVTTMQFYLAVLQTLFARILDVQDICIGVTDAGRPNMDFSETIGHFTNLLPMQFRIERTQPFIAIAQATSRTVLAGLDHSRVPIEVLLQRLGMQRASTHPPLFQVAFNYRIGDLLQRKLGNCSMDLAKYVDAKTPYDFTFNITQTAKGHLIELSSRDYLYSMTTTKFLLDTYVHLLKSLPLDQSHLLNDYQLHIPAHIEQSINLGRGPIMKSRWPNTLIDRFYQVCSEHPASVAIRDDHGQATYRELADLVGSIAHALSSANITQGCYVSVLCVPSITTYAAMLGILHTGALYMPLDPTLPAIRHEAMIKLCKPDLMLFHSSTERLVAEYGHSDCFPLLNLSKLPLSIPRPPKLAAHDEGFLLFTSGSTGTPKGIKLTQSGMMNYAAAKHALLGIEQITVLQQSNTGFDMAIAQAFNAFVNAGTLIVASPRCRGDPMMLSQLMLEECIDFTIATPSEYLMMAMYAADPLKKCKSWRFACSGGERITDELISGLRGLDLPDLSLTDCYGPTEVSCAVTLQHIPLDPREIGAMSVGKAIPNTSIHIVDEKLRLLPSGFSGEICVSGCGVAKGYLDQGSQSPKFVGNPWATPDDVSRGWNVLYKTGDKGCLREDGSLVFLGRVDGDSLVKLRGMRIELNEVSQSILQAARGLLANAAVTLRGPPGEGFLVAHVVFSRRDQNSATQAQLETLCATLPLPRYMKPSMIVPVDQLPITPNGKLDRRAIEQLPLPIQDSMANDERYLTVAEGELKLVWRSILGERVGFSNIKAETDFFAVGGSSLLLVKLQNALSEKMGVRIPLHELYHASTLRSMAAATSKERGRLVTESIDWAKETSIPNQILDIASGPITTPPRSRQRHVILTGATGFLGGEILSVLINLEDVAKIYCIAVPADSQQKLPSNTKLSIYSGSLRSPNLGLSKTEIVKLQSEMDMIIHAGASGHCLNNYSSLRDANFLSTQFLVEMALPRRVPLHFISSPRIILQGGCCSMPPVSMAGHPPPTDGSQGFTASKWASECFLEKIASKTGLQIMIHRPCSVTGSRAPHDDAMNSIIRYSILSRTVPDLPNIKGFFDFKDVEVVAADIVDDAILKSRTRAPSITFRHYSSGVKVSFGELAQRMADLYGGHFQKVNIRDWIGSARKLGIDDLIVSYLEANVIEAGTHVFPYLGDIA